MLANLPFAIRSLGQDIQARQRRQRLQLMPHAIAAARRLLARARGAALVGYTSLMLLFAVAAVAMLGHASGSAKPARNASITSSD